MYIHVTNISQQNRLAVGMNTICIRVRICRDSRSRNTAVGGPTTEKPIAASLRVCIAACRYFSKLSYTAMGARSIRSDPKRIRPVALLTADAERRPEVLRPSNPRPGLDGPDAISRASLLNRSPRALNITMPAYHIDVLLGTSAYAGCHSFGARTRAEGP